MTKGDGRDLVVVGIGASAGGIQAAKRFFEHVAPDSGAAYIVTCTCRRTTCT
jgi:hypothetical protein